MPTQSRTAPSSDERRAEVARATWKVIAREGLDRASLRAIAQELGCTTGVLTHYFRDKEALLDFSLAAIVDVLTQGDMQDHCQQLSRAGLRAELLAALPLNAEAQLVWNVWLSFTAASLSRPKQHQRHARLYADIRTYWRERLGALHRAGVLRADVDIELEAANLFCLIDGIGVQTLISPEEFSTDRQTRLIDQLLDKICATET